MKKLGRKRTTAALAVVGAMAVSLLVGSPAKADSTSFDIAVGKAPHDIAVSGNGDVYVATDSGVSVIDAETRKVTTVDVGGVAQGVATLGSSTAYVSVAGKAGAAGSVVIMNEATVAGRVKTGANPQTVAINQVTRKVYVSYSYGITVIDPWAEHATVDIPYYNSTPRSMVVDSSRNRVFVPTGGGVLTVIDGQTNFKNVYVLGGGDAIGHAVNTRTNEVFQTLAGSYLGRPQSDLGIVEDSPHASFLYRQDETFGKVAVDSWTGNVYVESTNAGGSSSIVLVNPATAQKIAQISVPSEPTALAVDSTRHRTYAPLSRGGVAVIDSSNTSSVVRTGVQPVAVAVHEYTGATYVANQGSASVTVVQSADPRPVKNDFNNDRNADVLARDGSGVLWLYPGDGAGDWLDRRQVGQGWNIMTSMVTPGDFNGDGYSDVLARDSSGVLWLYGGNGSAGWLPRVQIGLGWSGMTAITSAGDFNGDGNLDVAARDGSGVLWLYPGNGKGGWLTRVQIGSGWSSMTDILGVGDFNTDGASDLMARDSGGRLWLYPGNGAGGWLPQVQYGQGWNGMTALFATGDFSGDRKADIMARDSSGALWLFSGSGGAKWPIGSVIGQGWNGMTAIL
ncbi:FG-GAP-like repeat-containing protein [Paenarthrobacter sp. CM16]|uniref:FG-GAP-like repeat-containing protein n=1 Tax=Paenarthrobacter sp. CM16 TaxID=2738447 RepID=UPI0020A66670|nr:FG-GAP-like repeat-containing protein [Paenarthrobacter sp. CM16]